MFRGTLSFASFIILQEILFSYFAVEPCELGDQHQWCAEYWWSPGRVVDCMLSHQILVLSSGVLWPLLLDIRCLWRHNMTLYSRFLANGLTKCADTIDTTCILFCAHFFTRCCAMCHCNEHNQHSKVRRPKQSTALNAKTKQCTSAKIQGYALK